jgi:hypothetical protein
MMAHDIVGSHCVLLILQIDAMDGPSAASTQCFGLLVAATNLSLEDVACRSLQIRAMNHFTEREVESDSMIEDCP